MCVNKLTLFPTIFLVPYKTTRDWKLTENYTVPKNCKCQAKKRIFTWRCRTHASQ